MPVGLLFDNDVEGENGAHIAISLLAENRPVYYGGASSMLDAQFKNRQPESISQEEWQVIQNSLSKR